MMRRMPRPGAGTCGQTSGDRPGPAGSLVRRILARWPDTSLRAVAADGCPTGASGRSSGTSSASRDRAAPRLLPADGERRLGRPRDPFLRGLRRRRLRAVARRPVPAPPRTRGRAAAGRGRHLRRGRQHGEPDRDLGGALPGCGPPPGLGPGHRALRGERRGDLLVRVGHHRLPGPRLHACEGPGPRRRRLLPARRRRSGPRPRAARADRPRRHAAHPGGGRRRRRAPDGRRAGARGGHWPGPGRAPGRAGRDLGGPEGPAPALAPAG